MYKLNGSNLRVMLHAASEECGDDMEILELVKKFKWIGSLKIGKVGAIFSARKEIRSFLYFRKNKRSVS